jgi:hypothetical protein
VNAEGSLGVPRLPVDPSGRRKRYCRGIEEEAEVCGSWVNMAAGMESA